MAVLETSFLVDILRNRNNALMILDELESKESSLFITSPTVMELWEGALRSYFSVKEKSKVDNLISSVSILYLDVNSAKRSAEIEFEVSKKGMPIEEMDAMIAGIAMEHGEILVTNDSDYTRIPGLKVLKY